MSIRHSIHPARKFINSIIFHVLSEFPDCLQPICHQLCITIYSAQTFQVFGLRGKLHDFCQSLISVSSLIRAKRNDSLSGKIIAFQKCPDGHWRCMPPHGTTYEDDVILRYILHLILQRRTNAFIPFLLCYFGARRIFIRIRSHSFNAE